MGSKRMGRSKKRQGGGQDGPTCWSSENYLLFLCLHCLPESINILAAGVLVQCKLRSETRTRLPKQITTFPLSKLDVMVQGGTCSSCFPSFYCCSAMTTKHTHTHFLRLEHFQQMNGGSLSEEYHVYFSFLPSYNLKALNTGILRLRGRNMEF